MDILINIDALINALGWTATCILAVKALPQVIKSYRKGNGRGISPTFLWLWLVGQVMMLSYLLAQSALMIPVITYVSINLVMVLIIMRYRYFPREDNHDEIILSEAEVGLE